MLLKFWFAPAVTAAVFAVIQLVGFGFYAGHVGDFTADGGFVDVAGYVGYAALLVVLWKNRGVLEKRSFDMNQTNLLFSNVFFQVKTDCAFRGLSAIPPI